MSSQDQPNQISRTLRTFGESVFTEINRMAIKAKAVNLSQGCPDFDAPAFIREAAQEAINSGNNQYGPMGGATVLADAIVHDARDIMKMEIEAASEVTVTCGCTEAIAASILGILHEGDEVVIMDPAYDSYRPCLALANVTSRSVTMKAPDFSLDAAAIDAACSDRTRAIMINTPHNPTGRVFTRTELESLAEVCRRRDLLVFSDEVYNRMVFEGEHVSIASLPGMAERTVTLCSLGKTFSVTGWKIGWSIAPPHLTAGIRAAHQFLTFGCAHPLQHAAAVALRNRDDYYGQLVTDYRQRRDLLCEGLHRAGFSFNTPEGGYFVLCNHTHLGQPDDVAACRWLIEHAGVAAIPPSSFYANPTEGSQLIRFAFCKRIETIEAALGRLSRL